MSTSRREIISASALTALSYSRVLGANDRVQMGLIGCGDRGTHVMQLFQASNRVDVVALCDVYPAKIDNAKTKSKATSAKTYHEHQELIANKSVDVTLIATPDHWHSTVAIDALNAKKDVYVEKPLTLKIEEGPAIVKAARVNERICQVGMQQRSGRHYLQAKAEYIDSGKLGKIPLCRTWWHGNGYHLRKAPAELQLEAFEPRLVALPRAGEMARLRSAAVLQLARVSRFRRRPGD
jgi:predicted dehydrogenase